MADRLWERHRRRILLGSGRSFSPDLAYAVVDRVAALEHLLGVHRMAGMPLGVVGHSMGTVLSAELARRRRERMGPLVLIGLPKPGAAGRAALLGDGARAAARRAGSYDAR